eukprot:TRINITY_DN30939_c0_g1_i1.p1 TRINITY_DN30939_c0_g1~~TRINITY_DN30939_c0_g1_i1.p1  ORF type:complete len:447 (-),score=46.26 TRINITY_DN30939_c0_g1_i1:300-1553(-)
MAEQTPPSGAGPYQHSEHAVCIRDSEGSFQQRRRRLSSLLEESQKVTKMDLMQRNIVQGVNVVRRGVRMLEEPIEKRPSLVELMGAGKLPQDYLDRIFPDDSVNSVAPLAERIERVSLSQLLAPAPSGGQPGGGGAGAASAATAAATPMPVPQLNPAGMVGMVPQFPFFKAGGPAPQAWDPTVIASMMAQAQAFMNASGLPGMQGKAPFPMPGPLPAGMQLPPAQMAAAAAAVGQAPLNTAMPATTAAGKPKASGDKAKRDSAKASPEAGLIPAGLLPKTGKDTRGGQSPKPDLQAWRNIGATGPQPESGTNRKTESGRQNVDGTSAQVHRRPAQAAQETAATNPPPLVPTGGGVAAAGGASGATNGTAAAPRRRESPFLQLIDAFCDRAIGPEEAQASVRTPTLGPASAAPHPYIR